MGPFDEDVFSFLFSLTEMQCDFKLSPFLKPLKIIWTSYMACCALWHIFLNLKEIASFFQNESFSYNCHRSLRRFKSSSEGTNATYRNRWVPFSLW